jgi:4,5-dihydroxyphthalate decarboxylase
MNRLRLTLACWDYDRTRALADRSVQPDGIDLVYLTQPVEETFFRMLRHREFDCSEMSLSSYTASLNVGGSAVHRHPGVPFALLPPLVHFRLGEERHPRPEDLKGKRVGVPEYQMTAPVWIRGILSDDHGVKVTDVEHYSGGEEEPGRDEKIRLSLPASIRVKPIGPAQTLSRMLVEGELDALVTARAPSTFRSEPDRVQRLFPSYVEQEKAYYRRTKIFPIMHTVVIRRDVYRANPWVAQSLYKAFAAAKAKAFEMYQQTAALPAMLPWLVAHVEESRREMGEDWWPYGLAPNRHVLDAFLRYHHEQGLSQRRFAPEELFAKETLETYKV